MLYKIILSLCSLAIVTGCAPKIGNIHAMSEEKSKGDAEIAILRNYNLFASAVRAYPTINNQKIVGLYTKDYVHFYLKEGTYSFSLLIPDVLTGVWMEGNTIKKSIQKNQKYYFLVSPIINGMEIEEIDQKEGKERMSTSTLIHTGSLSEELDPIARVIKPVADIIGLDEER